VLLSEEDRSKALRIYEKTPKPWIYLQAGANEAYRSWPYVEEFCMAVKRAKISIIAHGLHNPQLADRCIHRDTDILTSCAIIEALTLWSHQIRWRFMPQQHLKDVCGHIRTHWSQNENELLSSMHSRGSFWVRLSAMLERSVPSMLISGDDTSECLKSIKVDHVLPIFWRNLQ
jgi:hypothetical protein